MGSLCFLLLGCSFLRYRLLLPSHHAVRSLSHMEMSHKGQLRYPGQQLQLRSQGTASIYYQPGEWSSWMFQTSRAHNWLQSQMTSCGTGEPLSWAQSTKGTGEGKWNDCLTRQFWSVLYATIESHHGQEAQIPDTGRLRSLIGNLVTWLLRLVKPILAVVFVPLPNDSF